MPKQSCATSRPKNAAKTERPSIPIPTLLQIVVECESERQQQDLFERMRKMPSLLPFIEH